MTESTDDILYLSRKDVERACVDIDSVSIIREAFIMHGSRQTILPDEAYLGWTNAVGEPVRSLNMPGYIGGSWEIAGTKIINGNIANTRRGMPRASGLTLLFDPVSVRVNCIMEGAYISTLRTASVTALSVDLLTGRIIRCMAVIGVGILARAHVELLARQLPSLQLIQIFDTDADRIVALQRDMHPVVAQRGIALERAASAEEAIRSAQLIIPVTTTTTGYIRYEWLQPGALLVNVSLDDVLSEVVFQADAVIVDDWKLVKDDPRRLIGRMYREGKIIGPDECRESQLDGRRQIDAQLGEIITGKKIGRRTVNDIILVNPFGLAIEDMALAMHVYQVAQKLGLGIRLER